MKSALVAKESPAALRALLVLLVSMTAIAAAPVFAAPDWNRLDDTLEGGVGLHAGWIGGTGLAFKYPLKWWFQLQVAGGIWNTKSNQRHNVGLEAQYLLRQDPRLRLYLLSGLGYYSRKKLEKPAGEEEFWDSRKAWNTGFGVGVEWLTGERWSLKVDLSFTHRNDKETIMPWPQVGLFYYW